jgi:hypothetical protein
VSDITEGLDLLGDFLDAKGYTEEAGLCTRAMDEINRLREALSHISLASQNSMSSREECGRIARAAVGESDE